MELLTLNCLAPTSQLPGHCATIGFFDGVHRGHQHLLQQVRASAKSRGLSSMAVTFDNHPLSTLHPRHCPQLITTLEDRLKQLELQGISTCALLHFSTEMSQVTAEDFMRDYLQKMLNVKCLVIGHDHRFGHPNHEGFADYSRYGEQMGLEVLPAEAYRSQNVTISSSAIRKWIAEGQVALAADGLGRPYALSGTVCQGHQMGRKMGYPTANLQPASPLQIIPRQGVYAVWAENLHERHPAMVNIGIRPTLANGDNLTIEAHLIGYSGNLYGQPLTLHFIQRLRDEQRYPSLEALRNQLSEDVQNVLKILSA